MSPPPGVGGGDTIAILTSCTASPENPDSGDTVILSAQVENVSAGDTRADLYVGFSFNDARTGSVGTEPQFVAAKGGGRVPGSDTRMVVRGQVYRLYPEPGGGNDDGTAGSKGRGRRECRKQGVEKGILKVR